MSSKRYDEQFKRDAVNLMTDQGYSLAKASESLGVSQASLSVWKKTLQPQKQTALAAENAMLQKRIRELEMERDILKKAATYFASQNK